MNKTTKLFFFCTFICLQQAVGKHARRLIVGGETAEPGRYDYFATISKVKPFSDAEIVMVGGALITPNVILFGITERAVSDFESGEFGQSLFNGAQVTIGRAGDNELRNITAFEILELDQLSFLNRTAMIGLAVLDSPSTKLPVQVDSGKCDLNNGCLNASIIGRGRTEYLALDFNSSAGPSLSQSLQQVDFTLTDPGECIDYFDGDTLIYDYFYQFYAQYYDCEDLSCANKTKIIDSATRYQEELGDEANSYVDLAESLFRNKSALCLRSFEQEQSLCNGDIGAPVLLQGEDVLLGLYLATYNDCLFPGEYDIFPTSFFFVSTLLDSITSVLATLPGADSSLVYNSNGDSCQCKNETDNGDGGGDGGGDSGDGGGDGGDDGDGDGDDGSDGEFGGISVTLLLVITAGISAIVTATVMLLLFKCTARKSTELVAEKGEVDATDAKAILL